MISMSSDVIKWLIAGAIAIIVSLMGVFTPKIFTYIKNKIGTVAFEKYLSYAQYAYVNIVSWFKANPQAALTAKEIYEQFVTEITLLIPYVTSAQINDLFYHVVIDIAKELNIDISEFSSSKLGIVKLTKVNYTDKKNHGLFGEKKEKPLFS